MIQLFAVKLIVQYSSRELNLKMVDCYLWLLKILDPVDAWDKIDFAETHKTIAFQLVVYGDRQLLETVTKREPRLLHLMIEGIKVFTSTFEAEPPIFPGDVGEVLVSRYLDELEPTGDEYQRRCQELKVLFAFALQHCEPSLFEMCLQKVDPDFAKNRAGDLVLGILRFATGVDASDEVLWSLSVGVDNEVTPMQMHPMVFDVSKFADFIRVALEHGAKCTIPCVKFVQDNFNGYLKEELLNMPSFLTPEEDPLERIKRGAHGKKF